MKPGPPPVDDAVPPPLRKWFLAGRPFSLPASTMAVVFGTVLGITIGGAQFHLLRFVAAFVGMAILHTAANLMNDVYDYRKGLDRRVNPVSGGVVRGWITPKQSLTASMLMTCVGSLIGIWLALQVPEVLWIGVIGVIIGLLYTWGPFPLKYNGLGDLAVFLNFGILGSLGAWTIQTGSLSWVPAVWAIPSSLLVAGILHANNWRDITGDTGEEIRTMASLFGDKGSVGYYAFLLFTPYAFFLVYAIVSNIGDLNPRMPWTMLIVFFSLPVAIGLFKKGLKRHEPDNPLDWLALDGSTAQLNLLFGLLATVGLGLHALIS
jgi:1,4-dihydroxy-2-naphthoate octaprenyltransferase